MRSNRMLQLFEVLIAFAAVIISVPLAIAVYRAPPAVPGPSNVTQASMAGLGGLGSLVLALVAVGLSVLVFRLSGGRKTFFVRLPWFEQRGFAAVYVTFALIVGIVVSGLYVAVSFGVPTSLISLVSGLLFGGFVGAAMASFFELSVLYTGIGAFFGFSADAGIAYAGGDVAKTALGALAQFIVQLEHSAVEAMKATSLEPFSETTMSLFLWPTAFGVLATLAIGIYGKSKRATAAAGSTTGGTTPGSGAPATGTPTGGAPAGGAPTC